MSNYILGLNFSWHDSCAVVLKDGEILSYSELDKISRVKNDKSHNAYRAIQQVLNDTNLTLDDMDTVAVGWGKTASYQFFGLKPDFDTPYKDSPKEERIRRQWDLNDIYHTTQDGSFLSLLFPRSVFEYSRTPQIRFVNHHLSHAYSGYLTSGFEDAAVLVVDGGGDNTATSIFTTGENGVLELVKNFPTVDSIGLWYDLAAFWTGLGLNNQGKFMGLAAYGKDTGINTSIALDPEGYHFTDIDTSYSNWIGNLYGITLKHMDSLNPDHRVLTGDKLKAIFEHKTSARPFLPIKTVEDPTELGYYAATIQSTFERLIMHLLEVAKKLTGKEKVVFAGGCSLNCCLNGIAANTYGDNFWVPFAPHDAGVALGAALYVYQQQFPDTKFPRLTHAYWGHTPTQDDIQSALDSLINIPYVKADDMTSRVAKMISEGKIVGWFQGRSEVGQRALGNRSMLGDPRKFDNWRYMNVVKGREVWRPLAPSVLKEFSQDYFDSTSELNNFMLGSFPVREEMRDRIPAAVHVDGSARPQFVDKETNPKYWDLINEFYKLTGVPVLINTSFNLAWEPIVNSPKDAIHTFLHSNLDVLVIEDYIIEKGK